MQWAKAIIFTEREIVARKGCNPKFEELIPYFKAYESRDNTIGQGISRVNQVSSCSGSIMKFIATTLLWCTVGVAMQSRDKASAWQSVRQRKASECTC